ncbi:uncharacterized protein BJ171DRAFT_608116 [Polychytrium aggregatum]|uniref:uncharacterized protein n=1 Tax=Polychytrium aggregatum TaxID=110093 RepID=UPI0022FEF485|nr:uncharacterized protein BJ171DRAFT_594019 [Polychytrium aggregatum]XP_052961428.1 uncharacterized protein BJ171DRAFT_608116 [Polychytrium aggregatum]KAI9183758.1 hypothetical protein BJ171DRAFT_594019 [Polychytrium aggregatum]KAI9187551.1 hypothetical protein BJ171DRAFT_608116 [Polychytrium aggregatum]
MKAVPMGCCEFMTPIRDAVLASGNDMAVFMAWSKDMATIDSKNREIESQKKQLSLDAYKTALECIKGVEDKTTAFGILDRAEAFIYGTKRTKLSDPEDTQPGPSARPTTPTPQGMAAGVEELPDERWSFQKLDITGFKHAIANPVDRDPTNFKTVFNLIDEDPTLREFFGSDRSNDSSAMIIDGIVSVWFEGLENTFAGDGLTVMGWRKNVFFTESLGLASYYITLHPFIRVIINLYLFNNGNIGNWYGLKTCYHDRLIFE